MSKSSLPTCISAHRIFWIIITEGLYFSWDKWRLFHGLDENAYKYSFILRYPPGKQESTGTSYEPWHDWYVGIDILLYKM